MGGVGQVRNAIYDFESDETAWLTGMAEAFGRLIPEARQTAVTRLGLHDRGVRVENVGPASPPVRLFLSAAAAAMPKRQIQHIVRRAPTAGTFSEWVQPLGVENFWKSFSLAGLRIGDFEGLRTVDGGDVFLSLSAWFGEERRMNARRRETLQALGAHMATTFRLRRALAEVNAPLTELPSAEAVVSADGFARHAVGGATASSARDALRAHVRLRERARTRRGQGEQTLWLPLVEGRWSLIDHFDTDGQRFYVALPNDPQFGARGALSVREAQVARMAAQGASNKEAAYALGLTASTVATVLRRCLAKLRLPDRLHLPFIAESSAQSLALGGEELRVATAELTVPAQLTPAEAEVAIAAARGRSDVSIAARRRVSPHTVANLLASVYRKLSVGGRGALAARLAKRPLAHREESVPQ